MGANFETADSAAWLSQPMNMGVYNIEYNDDGSLRLYSEDMNDPDDVSNASKRRTVHSFQAYYAYVTELMNGEPAVDPDPIMERQDWSTEKYIEWCETLK